MRDITLVSFYTPNWEYPAHAKRLAAECEALGIPRHIVEKPDRGSYLANCRWKPVVLLDASYAVNGPMLWVDVDGSVLRKPSLPDVDFMAFPKRDRDERQWHVGTLYFGATPAALNLLERWIMALEEGISDELALDRVWKSGHWRGDSRPLPREYFQMEHKRVRKQAAVVHRLSKSEQKRAFQRGRAA